MRRMLLPSEYPRLTKAELYARLAAGAQSGTTVVTPNQRLAVELKRQFDDTQAGRGLNLWDSADILSFSAYVERAYEDLLYSGRAAAAPILLAPAQELALWESIIRGSVVGESLLAIPETARLASEAWTLTHAWRIETQRTHISLNEDATAYQEWARRFERDTRRERLTDSARIADLVAVACAQSEFQPPKMMVCHGFDMVTPQQVDLLAAMAAAGCSIAASHMQPREGSAFRVACEDARDEIRCAANWARARLETGANPRIGVVVPDFSRQRAALVRAFSATLAPDCALPGTIKPTLPFNVSLGSALSSYPLVHAAFLVLELAGRDIEFERASRLLRAPFIGAAEAEYSGRARLDARLRKRAEPLITLDRLQSLMLLDGAGCPLLARLLSTLAGFRKERLFGAQSPSTYAKAISDALKCVGFPGERSLDSTEYQTLKKWHDVIAAFAALDRVVPRLGYADAVSRLRRMCAYTLFQPETPDVPIQIMGVLEAAAMEFDHLWVMGLSDAAWPPGPRPNPFLPNELQRAAHIPQSSAAESLEFARRITAQWLTSADEVVFSYPRREDDRELNPSPLIVEVAESALSLPVYPDYGETVHRASALESGIDIQAPPLEGKTALGGGSAVIGDHAACPFRAFALHRLGAESLHSPHTGLDAMERGTLVHRVLAQAWSQLRTQRALVAMDASDLDAMLGHAADEAVTRIKRDRPTTLGGRFAQIEKQRLVRLARDWLDHEKTRAGFTVVATEDKRHIEIGGLALNARLDRVDELDSGVRIVIDYKTGVTTATAMLGERPDQPQLPLYLVAAEPEAAAIAFAQVRAGDMKFSALARDADLLPGIKAYADIQHDDHRGSWPQLVAAWRADLARIAADFVRGDATVDPKLYPRTCTYCEVKPFCRIYERMQNTLDEDAT